MKKASISCLNTTAGRLVLIVIAYAALMGCAKQGGAETTAASAQSSSPAATSGQEKAGGAPAAAQGKLNACTLVTKADAEAALEQPVRSAEEERSHDGTEQTAAFSECVYMLGSGQSVTLFVRRSPIADNTPEAIDRVRETMKGPTGKEAEEVKDLGSTAFWTGRQLHAFQGGNVYLYVTMMNFKDEEQAKAKAVELARKALATLPK